MNAGATPNIAVNDESVDGNLRVGQRGEIVRIVGVLAAVVLCAFWMFDRAPVSHAGGDSLWVLHTSASMVSDRDLDLSEYSPLIDGYVTQPPPHLMEVNGRRFDYFPWGGSLVAVPFVSVAAAATNITGGDVRSTLRTTLPIVTLERQVASLIGAVTVGMMYLLVFLRLRSVRWAVGLALLFAFGTGVMSTTTRNMWTQGPALLVASLVLVVAQLLASRRGAISPLDRCLAAAAGLLVVLAYATRPSTALLVPLMAVVAWQRGAARLVGVFLGSTALAFVGFVIVNLRTYGEWLPPYYRDRLAFSSSFGQALLANLVSPGRGLLIWSPFLLIGVVWCIYRWRDSTLLERLVVAWSFGHLLVISAFPHWWGGASVGPRLMLDVVPGLVLLLTAPIAVMRSQAPTFSLSAARGSLVVLLVLGLWAGFVNTRAAYRMSVMLWNWPSERGPSIEEDPDRVWDWSDPQFLR